MGVNARPAISAAEMAPKPQPIPRGAELKDHRPEVVKKGTPVASGEQAAARQKAQERRQELEDFTKRGDERRSMREAARPRQSLSETDIRQLQRVDAGLAVEAQQFDTYSSVVEEAGRTNRSIEDVCTAKKITEFRSLQQVVLERMSQMSYVQESIPGFADMTHEQQLTAVDAYAASHPEVRRQYVGKMKEIAARALQMPEEPKAVQDEATERRKNELAGEKQATVARMRARLGERGKNLTDDQIHDLYKGGRSVDEIEMDMVDTLLKQNKVNPDQYHARQESQANKARLETLQREFQEAHNKGSLSGSTFNLEGYLQGNQGDPRVVEYQRLTTRSGQIETEASQITPEMDATIRAVEDAVYGRINYAKGGVRVGGIREDLQALHEISAEERRIERTAKIPVQSPEAQQKSAERELLQNALKEEMEAALESTVAEVFDADYERLVEISDRKAEADAADAAERGDVRMHDAILALERNQKKHGVETDMETHKKKVHRTRIGEDVRRIIKDGDEGVRRMELRNMTEGNPPIISLQGADGSPLYYLDARGQSCAADAEGAKPATWETVRMDQLPAEDRRLLETIHTEQGDRLAKTILSDYFFALKPPMRHVEMLGTRTDLRLSDAEQADLAKYFGAEGVREAHKESRDYKKLDEILNEKLGAKKGGSLLALLLLLGVGGIFGKKKED